MTSENTIATAVRSLADYLIAERPGRVCREIIAIMERPLLVHVLALMGGNQRRAAHLLGLNRNTFHSRCRLYGLLSSVQAKNTARKERPQRVGRLLGS
jgi:DNA-binding protein Fis